MALGTFTDIYDTREVKAVCAWGLLLNPKYSESESYDMRFRLRYEMVPRLRGVRVQECNFIIIDDNKYTAFK